MNLLLFSTSYPLALPEEINDAIIDLVTLYPALPDIPTNILYVKETEIISKLYAKRYSISAYSLEHNIPNAVIGINSDIPESLRNISWMTREIPDQLELGVRAILS